MTQHNTTMIRSLYRRAELAAKSGKTQEAIEFLTAVDDEANCVRTGRNWRRKADRLRAEFNLQQ